MQGSISCIGPDCSPGKRTACTKEQITAQTELSARACGRNAGMCGTIFVKQGLKEVLDAVSSA